MDAQIKHFSESKNSMIQSAINEDLNGQQPGGGPGRGLNSGHERMHLLNKVLEVAADSRKAGAPHETFVQRALDWVKHLAGEALLKLAGSDYAEGFAILEQYVDARLAGNTALASQKLQELRFSDCDPNWINSMVQWFDFYLERMKTPQYVTYKSLDDYACQLPPTATGSLRVGLIGDWGTGEGRATAVLNQLFALKPDVIIHVGDVYYSGTEHEYQVNYLDVIEQARAKYGAAVPVYNLPGNHDYYSGGHAFYDSLQKVNSGTAPGTPVQEASFFALFNEHWHLQGMDTGYYDNDVLKVGRDTTHLVDSEVQWHQYQLKKALAAKKKVILLSHHQLFSRYLAIADQTYNPDLLGYFKDDIQAGNICAWFWGHEHLAAVYKPYLGLAKGRCVGHGAVPIFYENGAPYAEKASLKGVPLADLPEELLATNLFPHDSSVYHQGFTLLELNADQTGKARYFFSDETQPAAVQVFEEDLC